MENEYGYANARLRAMKSRLLTRSAYMELANEPSVEDVIADLTRTPYQGPVEAALVKSSGWACLSEALRVYFAQTIARISNFFGGKPKQLWRILVSRWEVFNLKTILRGQANNVPADEILDALIPTGELQESDFKRLVQQTSVRATVDLLSTWNNPHARALRAAMPRYAETDNLAELELALDRAHYKQAFKELNEMEDANADMVRSVLEDQVDATNLMTVVRLATAGVASAKMTKQYGSAGPEPLLVKPGGHITTQLLAYKEVPTLEQLVRDLRETKYGDALARALTRYNEKKSLAAFEDEIEGQLAKQEIGLFNRDPLSIGIAIAYLAALVNEVRNLRLIGRGKSIGWKREEIEKELRQWQS